MNHPATDPKRRGAKPKTLTREGLGPAIPDKLNLTSLSGEVFLWLKGGENMGISMETRNQIVNFYPDKVVVEGQKINYGNIGDFDVVFGNFPVQERLVSHPKQPLLFSWKTRPALALEKANGRCEIHPLVYNNDIKAERIAVIRALAVHLGIEKQPSWHRRLLDRLEDLFRR